MNDMTKGNPRKQLLVFMIPVLLGNLFQNFYGIIDQIIVGQYLGVDALAAVGMTGSITFLVIGWLIGMTTGFGLLVAQSFGAQDESKMRHYTAMSTYICSFFAITMTVGLLFANDMILKLMNTPDNIYADTKAYIGIIYMGISISILYNMLASLARAMGDSKTPLYFLILSSVLNVGLDFLFVGYLPLGVAGAAYATVLSQTIAAISCFVYVFKKYPELHFNKEEGRIKWRSIGQLMAMGIPMALQFSITAIGTMIVQSSLNLLGSTYIAVYSGCMKIQNLLLQISVAVGAAIANFVGQNYGANKLDRVRKGVREGVYILIGYNIVAMIFSYYISPQLIVFFAEDTGGELVRLSTQLFHITCWFYIPLGLIFVYRNALQGLGNGFVPMLGGVAELIARAVVIFLLFEPLQFVGICISDPIAWFSALIPLIPYYYWYMHRIEKNLELQHKVNLEKK